MEWLEFISACAGATIMVVCIKNELTKVPHDPIGWTVLCAVLLVGFGITIFNFLKLGV